MDMSPAQLSIIERCLVDAVLVDLKTIDVGRPVAMREAMFPLPAFLGLWAQAQLSTENPGKVLRLFSFLEIG